MRIFSYRHSQGVICNATTLEQKYPVHATRMRSENNKNILIDKKKNGSRERAKGKFVRCSDSLPGFITFVKAEGHGTVTLEALVSPRSSLKYPLRISLLFASVHESNELMEFMFSTKPMMKGLRNQSLFGVFFISLHFCERWCSSLSGRNISTTFKPREGNKFAWNWNLSLRD